MGIQLGSRATRPYPRPPWLQVRFSLRVVLLAITAMCIGLGLVAYRTDLRQRASNSEVAQEVAKSRRFWNE